MGRVQTFESATAVRAARDMFWDRGYDGTSIVDLERGTGLNRSSLYHAFGSKRGLFDAAVDDYLDAVVRPRLEHLRAGAADGTALLEYFTGLRQAVDALPSTSPRRGCLLVNCATGLATRDEAAREVVDGYRAELTAALRQALAAASRSAGDADRLEARARMLASLSMSAMLLARVNAAESVAMIAAACDHIRSWTR